jgi:ADP-heptose:LPS heptosyltransferase
VDNFLKTTRSNIQSLEVAVIELKAKALRQKFEDVAAVLAGAPLMRVAEVLSRCWLFLGNDSGLTHLAAALGGPAVVALFGPTDPGIWAPPGKRVRILTGTCPQAPCARDRKIPCPKPQCLEDLPPERVLAVAGEIMQYSDCQK